MNGQPRLFGPRLEFRRNLSRYAMDLTKEQVRAGHVWWPNASLEIARLAIAYSLHPKRLAYAAAALSPGIPWQGTMSSLVLLLQASRDGLDMPRGVGSGHLAFGYRGRERAWKILQEGNLKLARGPKVEAVAQNLMGNLDAVSVDRHIVRAATGADLVQVSELQTRRIADAVRYVAAVRGWEPAGLQAAIWLAERAE